MRAFYIVEGDTDPPLEVQLLDEKGDPIPLTGATIKFNLGNLVRDGPVEIVNEQESWVRYNWNVYDTEGAAGIHHGQFVIEKGSGKRRTVPNDDEAPLLIVVAKRV